MTSEIKASDPRSFEPKMPPSLENVHARLTKLSARLNILHEAMGWVRFYNCLTSQHLEPKPKLSGTLLVQAKQVKDWLNGFPEGEGPAKVQKLDLINKNLTFLPPEIGKFTGLLIVDLRGNKLKKLPDEIVNCKQLNALQAEGNLLTELPADIGNLENLEDLYLNNNKISKLPDTFKNLSKLQTVDLRNNPLTEMPFEQDLQQMTALQTIRLTGTSFGLTPVIQDQLSIQHRNHCSEEMLAMEKRNKEIEAAEAAEAQKHSGPPSPGYYNTPNLTISVVSPATAYHCGEGPSPITTPSELPSPSISPYSCMTPYSCGDNPDGPSAIAELPVSPYNCGDGALERSPSTVIGPEESDSEVECELPMELFKREGEKALDKLPEEGKFDPETPLPKMKRFTFKCSTPMALHKCKTPSALLEQKTPPIDPKRDLSNLSEMGPFKFERKKAFE